MNKYCYGKNSKMLVFKLLFIVSIDMFNKNKACLINNDLNKYPSMNNLSSHNIYFLKS